MKGTPKGFGPWGFFAVSVEANVRLLRLQITGKRN